MHQILFATAATLLALSGAAVPTEAQSNRGGGAYWSLPAGARFLLQSSGKHHRGLGGRGVLIVSPIVDRHFCCDHRGLLVVRRGDHLRLPDPHATEIRRFDPISRTVSSRRVRLVGERDLSNPELQP